VLSQDYEKGIVALTCWREMRGELAPGMISVAQVLYNRAKAGWHNSSMYENAIATNQFSSMTIKGDANTVQFPDSREPEFVKLLQFVDGLYSEGGAFPVDLTNGALYYAVLADSTSTWFFNNIASRPDIHPRTAVIGKTTFFK
jgi:hypothetical protein